MTPMGYFRKMEAVALAAKAQAEAIEAESDELQKARVKMVKGEDLHEAIEQMEQAWRELSFEDMALVYNIAMNVVRSRAAIPEQKPAADDRRIITAH